MIIREATLADIPQMQIIRNEVKENILSNPLLVTNADVEDYIIRRGKGWVAESENIIIGFAIVSLIDHNVWALFIQPDFDKKGVGRNLHDTMLNWYFGKTDKLIWLSTAPATRAASFYRKAGWKEVGVYGKGELKFEMTLDRWRISKISAGL